MQMMPAAVWSRVFLPSNLLFKHVKINVCGSIIVPIVLYGCQPWSFTLREEPRLWVFENRHSGRYLGLRGWQ
jgi:hypothetical protein